MFHIAILSASVRTGRNSHRVALYFKKYIEENNLATVEIIDLNEYQFPVFNERLRFQTAQQKKCLTLSTASKLQTAY